MTAIAPEARFQDAQHRASFPIHFAILIFVIASASDCIVIVVQFPTC